MKTNFGKNRIVLITISMCVFLAGFLFLLLSAGVNPLTATLWTACPVGLSGQINLVWDVTRLAMSRFEPISALTRDARLRNAASWARYFMSPEIAVPKDRPYHARLYDTYTV